MVRARARLGLGLEVPPGFSVRGFRLQLDVGLVGLWLTSSLSFELELRSALGLALRSGLG